MIIPLIKADLHVDLDRADPQAQAQAQVGHESEGEWSYFLSTMI